MGHVERDRQELHVAVGGVSLHTSGFDKRVKDMNVMFRDCQ